MVAVPATDTRLLVDKGQLSAVNVKTRLETEIPAPVSKGQRLGTMTITCGDQVLKEIPLVAAEAVPRLTFWQIFGLVLKQFLGGK